MQDRTVYKVISQEDWALFQRVGVYAGSAVDRSDGFIHFSTADQLRETLRRHYRGQAACVVLAVEAGWLDPEELRWEPSRGGALFPHLYGVLPMGAVRGNFDVDVDAEGRCALPVEFS